MREPAEYATLPAPLVRAAASGDRAAFTELVATHHRDLLRLAMVITGDAEMADDAAQAAWHQAWRKLHQVRDPDRVRAWLLSIVANEARQALRRRSRFVALPSQQTAATPSRDPVDGIDLSKALAGLKAEERTLIGLRYVAGFSAPELAETLGLSPEGVRSRLKRILDRLRVELGE